MQCKFFETSHQRTKNRLHPGCDWFRFLTHMSKASDRESSPLTFDLKDDLLAKLESLQSSHAGVTKSEIIRHAIAVFDYSKFAPEAQGHRQISVRLPGKQKAALLKLSRQKAVSVGELLRVALESLPANLAGLKTKTAVVDTMKKAAKKAAKKAVKKAKKK